jgi:hypothetical protein
MADLTLSKSKDYFFFFFFFFFRFDGPSFDAILKTATPAIAEEILTCKKQSLAVSVFPLHYYVRRMEIILKT